MTIARVNPKEIVTFSMLSMNVDLPDITYVRCKGYRAKFVAVQNSRVFPRSVTWIIGWLMIAGIAATVYIVLQVGIWLLSVSMALR